MGPVLTARSLWIEYIAVELRITASCLRVYVTHFSVSKMMHTMLVSGGYATKL